MSQPRTPGRSAIAAGTVPVHSEHVRRAPAIESSWTGTYGLRWWRHIQHENYEGPGDANRRHLRWQRRGDLREAMPARGHRADFGVNGAEKGLTAPERWGS